MSETDRREHRAGSAQLIRLFGYVLIAVDALIVGALLVQDFDDFGE